MNTQTLTKENIVGVKELRQNLDKYINKINQGKSFTVFKRSRPVFKITPVTNEEDQWETVVDFTKIRKGGVPAKEVHEALLRLKDYE